MAKGDQILDLEQVLFVLQKKNPITQEWVTQNRHVYRGRTDANAVLQRIREDPAHKGEEWRALQKQEAERYREGWNDCAEYVERVYKVVVYDEEPDTPNMVFAPRRAHSGPNHGVRAPQKRGG